MKKYSDKNKLVALLGLWVLHGMIAFWQFIILPADQGSFFLGLSLERTLMNGVLLFWIFFNLVLIFVTIKSTLFFNKMMGFLRKPVVGDSVFTVALILVISRAFLYVVFKLLGVSDDFNYLSYEERLDPLLGLMFYVSLEIIFLVVFLNSQDWWGDVNIPANFWRRLLIVLTALGLVTLFISLTDFGIAVTYRGDWARGLPAVPLLEWQIVLSSLSCLSMIFFETGKKRIGFQRLDLWICFFIWFLTVAFWFGQPIVPNASALNPTTPNNEVYPFIDAQVYDTYAQSILIGNGLGQDQIPQRPIYIVFLAFLHVLVGQDYDKMIFAQSLFLALFPVLLYLVGTEFYGRPVGISIALLSVLRDYLSNVVSPFTGNLSYSKLYLSEIPTAILLALFLLLGLRWIKLGFPASFSFLMGGVLGVAMLIRTQTVVALPVFLFFALASAPKSILAIIKGVILSSFLIVIVVSPWLWRNWRITGELMFDNPASQTANLALRYSRLNGDDVNVFQMPGETNSDYKNRLLGIARRSILLNPLESIKAVGNSFLNHGVNNILLFPLRNDLQNIGELWIPGSAFWESWEGSPNLIQKVSLGFYIFLFGLGVATAWQKNGLLGFLPLGLNLAYNLWTSIALLSGQRFMVSMDWSVYLYYMIGIFALLSSFLFFLKSGRLRVLKWFEIDTPTDFQPIGKKRIWQYICAGLLFFGAGLSIPFSEKIFLKRYPSVYQESVREKVLSAPVLDTMGVSSACLKEVIVDKDLMFYEGRALYPRYYAAGDGEPFTDAVGYKPVQVSRIVFEMIGQRNNRIVFPILVPPDFFPNASDVTLGFDANDRIWLMLVEHGNIQKMYFSDLLDISFCKGS